VSQPATTAADIENRTDAAAPRALLLLGQAPEQTAQFHNQPEHWALLAEHLRAADLSTRWITDDLSVLNQADLARFDVVLNYSTGLAPTDDQAAALLTAIRGGVGFVGLHAATATFLNQPAYLAMVGARFRRHDPIKRFTIAFTGRSHPITAGLADYEHEDELYELTADFVNRDNVVPLDGIEVLAEAEGRPMVYVKRYGSGRVAYLAQGHDHRSLGHPTYRDLFTRAVAWAAGRL